MAIPDPGASLRFDLTHKVALVTGASSGLGSRFAQVLADAFESGLKLPVAIDGDGAAAVGEAQHLADAGEYAAQAGFGHGARAM